MLKVIYHNLTTSIILHREIVNEHFPLSSLKPLSQPLLNVIWTVLASVGPGRVAI